MVCAFVPAAPCPVPAAPPIPWDDCDDSPSLPYWPLTSADRVAASGESVAESDDRPSAALAPAPAPPAAAPPARAAEAPAPPPVPPASPVPAVSPPAPPVELPSEADAGVMVPSVFQARTGSMPCAPPTAELETTR